jgi:alkylhydroperoxidase family enzyme
MTRVTAIYKPSDYPGTPDEATRQDLTDLFGHLFPQNPNPEIDKSHSGVAIAAQNPRLALQLAKLSSFIAVELPWCQRRDLREVAIQTLNLHFKSEYSFLARMKAAQTAGVSVEAQKALPDWKNSQLFDADQRLVIEYTNAVVTGEVPAELFARVVDKFGEKGAVECTTLISFWSFWAMFLNATGPQLRPDA